MNNKKYFLFVFTIAALQILSVGCSKGLQPIQDLSNAQEFSLDNHPLLTEEPGQSLITPHPQGPIADAPRTSKVQMEFDPTPIALAHGPGVTWVGCSNNAVVRGGYNSDTTCGRAFAHPRFATALAKNFYGCVNDAASLAGIKTPAKVFINHFGSYNDRNARGSSRLSNHAFARALDINNFNLFDVNGNRTQISTNVRNYSGITAKFYDRFRDCWKATLPRACGSSSEEGDGSIGIPRSKLGGNSLHNDHIHLSLPQCAG
jgi:hypothetical protein